jgi:pSer/pThr/pTyr-binding forkhead associated (FHA) protein
MDLKLIVLAGAKEGLEIRLKKDKFLIGRAKECALRAGSDAISRRHCAIERGDDRWTVRDLGSRNGTYVNDQKITDAVPLAPGDELRVGPLKFRVAEAAPKVEAKLPKLAPAAENQPKKQPPVKGVADVVQRTISLSDSASEDDISRWLLGSEMNGADNLRETQTIKAEDTKTTLSRAKFMETKQTVEDVADAPAEGESASEGTPSAEAKDESKGGWSLFKRGSKAAEPKKKPGKLPPRPEQASKDSREAAADILREMQRRR